MMDTSPTLPRVRIQTEDFNVAAETAALRAMDKSVGAVCSFIGTVRDRNDGRSEERRVGKEC